MIKTEFLNAASERKEYWHAICRMSGEIFFDGGLYEKVFCEW